MNLELIFIFFFSITTILIHQYFRSKFNSIYFSLKQLIVSDSEDISISGVFLTFFPTFVFSLILPFIFTDHYRELVLSYSFLTSFLIIWPSILYPTYILSNELFRKRKALYIIYVVYVLINLGVSILAINLYNIINSENLFTKKYYNSFLSEYSAMHPLYQNIIAGIITAIIISSSLFLLKFVFNKIRG
ncbi:hypothetical protein [Paenibacillus agri]|uniref:Uncharacterized protein n=1 Tax=Paenibacillus agri TaxID=2744309 RepID=A0A850EIS8_9BACL|nr:hypothetical protein [Paenibacillus agri]NUU61263.1 hypothetical protein [Paenibacillus agri]